MTLANSNFGQEKPSFPSERGDAGKKGAWEKRAEEPALGVGRWNKECTLVFLGFPCGLAGRESACNVGDLGSIPELGRSPGEGKGYPLQCSGLEKSLTV